jgi:hypothetical protein
MNQREIFEKQLALDYSCSVQEVRSREHIFTPKEYREGRRIFRGDDCLVKIACVGGKLLVSAEGEMLDWCREHLKNASSAWLFDYPNLYELDCELRKRGHKIGSTHHFYLPGGAELYEGRCPEKGICLIWYEREDLEQFRAHNPFPEALTFLEKAPDMIALAALKDGKILGMAGASGDSETMWQIGINVTPEGEGRGIGTYLVTNLKNEIMTRGILPFYGTAESHVKSQKVGVQSGFLPAWAELYTTRR